MFLNLYFAGATYSQSHGAGSIKRGEEAMIKEAKANGKAHQNATPKVSLKTFGVFSC